MTTNPPVIQQGTMLEDRLRGVWARRTARRLSRGSGWIVAAFVAVVFADLLLDWGLDLPGGWRLALLAADIAVLGCVTYRGVLRRLHGYDAVVQAIEVERALPQLNGLLVSSVQFADERAYGPGVSRELMRAVRRQAALRASSLDLSRAGQPVPILSALACGAVALAVLAGMGVWKGPFLGALARRMLNPASEAAYPTNTRIEVLTGSVTVCAGQAVTLEARAGGVIPASGQVFVRHKGLDWESAPIDRSGESQFAYALSRVGDDLEYYFRVGDAKSPRHRITVAHPPRIVEGRVELRYPDYTRLQPQTIDTLNLKAPEGTILTWRLRFDQPVRKAELKLEGADPKEMQLDAGARAAHIEMPATASLPYTFNLHWRLADRDHTEGGARHYIQVIPDTDPQVGLVQPTEYAKATLKKTIHLSFWARDDYGLGDAAIVFSVNDSDIRLRHPLGRAKTENQYAWSVKQSFPDLKEGDIVTFAVEVVDCRPGTPGKTCSVSRRVHFVSQNEYVAYVLGRQRKLLGQLRPLYLQEKEAARHLQGVAAPAVPTTKPGPAPSTGRIP